MSDLLTAFWTAVTTAVTNLPTLIKQMFSGMLYDTGAGGTQTLSEFAKFSMCILGLSLCLGVGKFVVSIIRRKI